MAKMKELGIEYLNAKKTVEWIEKNIPFGSNNKPQ